MRLKRKLRRIKINKKIVIGLIIIVCIVIFDSQMQPLIVTMSKSAAIASANSSINSVVTTLLNDREGTYKSLIQVTQAGDGVVTAIQTDSMQLNKLKAELALEIQEKIRSKEASDISVALGTLIGGDLFTGRGPRIKARVELAGNVYTQLYSVFEEAGINQTHHKIILNVQCKINIIMFGYRTCADIETDFLIAETVIVGRVPDAYTRVEGLTTGALGRLNDYKAISQK